MSERIRIIPDGPIPRAIAAAIHEADIPSIVDVTLRLSEDDAYEIRAHVTFYSVQSISASELRQAHSETLRTVVVDRVRAAVDGLRRVIGQNRDLR